MSRILQNILRKQQTKMNVTHETSALLMEMARGCKDDNPHKLSAKLIQVWLNDAHQVKPDAALARQTAQVNLNKKQSKA
jgi:hypothetical protein